MGEKVETRIAKLGLTEEEFIENTVLLGWDEYAMPKLNLRTHVPLQRFFYEKTGNPNYGRFASSFLSGNGGLNLFNQFAQKLVEVVKSEAIENKVLRDEIERLKGIIEQQGKKLSYYEKQEMVEVEETMLNFIKKRDGG